MNKGIFDRVQFTAEDRANMDKLISLSASSDFVENNASHIVIRELVRSLPGNEETFVIYTSAHPGDTIEYTSNRDMVDLSRRDGGFF